MRNAGLEETQAGIKIAGRNINNLRYADDTTTWTLFIAMVSHTALFLTGGSFYSEVLQQSTQSTSLLYTGPSKVVSLVTNGMV